MDQTQTLRGLRSLHNWKMTTRVTFLCIGSGNEKWVGGSSRGFHTPFYLPCPQPFPMRVLPLEFKLLIGAEILSCILITVKQLRHLVLAVLFTWRGLRPEPEMISFLGYCLFCLLSQPAHARVSICESVLRVALSSPQ